MKKVEKEAMWYDKEGTGTYWDFWGWSEGPKDVEFNRELCLSKGWSFCTTKIQMPSNKGKSE